jgi:hypothetical protein
MKVKMIFLVALMAMVSSATISLAQENDRLFSVDVSTSAYSQYVGSLSGANFFDEAVLQPSITLTHNPSGLYANLWGSYSPEGGFDSDYGDEVDYIAGINRDIGSVNVDFYYAYYNCYKINRHSTGDVQAIGTTVTFPEILKIQPFVEAEYNFVKNASDENGLMYRIGGRVSPIENLSLELSAGGHSEIYGTRNEVASFVRCSLGYEIALAENLTLNPEINFQKRVGYSEKNGGFTDDVIWGGATFAYSF